MIRGAWLIIAFLLLASSALSDDRPLDPRRGPAAREQYELRLATNGDTWMAAWQDNRSGVFDVYASALDQRGQPRAPEGIAIATTGSCDATGVDVEWTGTSYTVSWTVDRALYAAQLSTEGTVVRAPAKILDLDARSGVPALAWNGSRYLVAWPVSEGEFAKSYVEGILLDADFEPVVPEFPISDTALQQPSVTLCAGDGRFLATWSNRIGATSYEIQTALVADDATISARHILQGVGSGATAWSGSSWATVWDGADGHVRFTTIGGDGTPSGTITVLPVDWVSGPDLEWDGSDFLVAFAGYRGPIFTLRVSSTGTPVDAGPIRLTDSSFGSVADLSHSAHGTLVGWTDYRTGVNIFDSLVLASATDARPPEQLLATSLEEQQRPAIAMNGTLGLMVWAELVDSATPALRAARVNASGVQLDLPLEIQRGSAIAAISVASSEDGFLVVWTASIGNIDRVFIARVSRAGEALDSPVEIGQSSQGLAVASDGSEFLVVWSEGGSRIRGARVRWTSSATLPFTIAESSAPNTSLNAPDVVFNGSAFVTSWLSATACGRNCYFQDIYVVAVSNDAAGVPTKLGAAAGAAKLASNGDHTLVAWPFDSIAVVLLDRELRTVARTAAGTTTARPADADVAWNGTRWFATWTEIDSEEWTYCLNDSRSHLESVSFAADLSDPVAAPLTATDGGSRKAAVAAAGGGVLLAYEQIVASAPELHRGGISRVFLRVIGAARPRATVR